MVLCLTGSVHELLMLILSVSRLRMTVVLGTQMSAPNSFLPWDYSLLLWHALASGATEGQFGQGSIPMPCGKFHTSNHAQIGILPVRWGKSPRMDLWAVPPATLAWVSAGFLQAAKLRSVSSFCQLLPFHRADFAWVYLPSSCLCHCCASVYEHAEN